MIIIRTLSKGASKGVSKGRVLTRTGNFECRLGKNGTSHRKVEGDHKTPIGAFTLSQVLWRPDRLPKPQTGLPLTKITKQLGWCDDSNSPLYNRLVKLPCNARCERLWRSDNRYDVIIVVEYNSNPAIKNKGSAIFIHPCDTATAGCIGMKLTDLLKLIRPLSLGSKIVIG